MESKTKVLNETSFKFQAKAFSSILVLYEDTEKLEFSRCLPKSEEHLLRASDTRWFLNQVFEESTNIAKESVLDMLDEKLENGVLAHYNKKFRLKICCEIEEIKGF